MFLLPVLLGSLCGLVAIGVAIALLTAFVFNKSDGEIKTKSRQLVAENAQTAATLRVSDENDELEETVRQLQAGLREIQPSGKAAAWETDMRIKELLAAVKSLLADIAPATETVEASPVADKLQEILALLPERAKYKK